MFTKFDPVITPFTRHAENTDTHQYIRHHEREQNRRRRDHDALNEHAEYDDETSVSITALLLFLESMAERPDVQMQDNSTHNEEITSKNQNSKTKDSPSLYAANAYAHAAKTMPEQAPINNYDPAKQSNLNSETHNPVITELITELRSLKKSGITELHIERGETFAESLFSAIAKARAPDSP